ncbi:MAG: hypothetical protein WAT12_07105 [Candidatus Nitrotoga sp.]
MTPHLLKVALLAITAGVAHLALADSWRYDPIVKNRVETYGETKIVQTTDARKNRQYPDFIVTIYSKGVLRAKYRGVAFQKLFPSPDNTVFVGLSNRGLPGTAVIVFDRDGNLRLDVKHNVAKFDYCEKSITLQRKWFDEDNPSVEFVADEKDGHYKSIRVRDCRGNTSDLFILVSQAFNRAFLEEQASHEAQPENR